MRKLAIAILCSAHSAAALAGGVIGGGGSGITGGIHGKLGSDDVIALAFEGLWPQPLPDEHLSPGPGQALKNKEGPTKAPSSGVSEK